MRIHSFIVDFENSINTKPKSVGFDSQENEFTDEDFRVWGLTEFEVKFTKKIRLKP